MKIFILMSALSFAEEGGKEKSTSEPEQDTSTTPMDKPKAQPKAQPKAEPSDNAAAVRVPVVVVLRNGMRLEGTARLEAVISWNVGQPIGLLVDGANTETEIPADKIQSLTDSSSAPSTNVDDNIAVYPTAPVSPQGYAYPNSAPTRYLYAPSSIGLQKGQGYISQKLVFTSVAYAPSDNITLLFGTFTFFPPALSVFGGKYAAPINDNLSFSVGGEVFVLGLDSSNRIPVGVGYLGMTWGDTDQNITVSSGVARDNNLLSSSGQIWPIMVAGQKRVHNRFSFVSENWIFTDLGLSSNSAPYIAGGLGSFSVRLLGRRDSIERIRASKVTQEGYPRSTWDIGFVVLVDAMESTLMDYRTGETITGTTREYTGYGPLPWVDYTWHFGPVRR